MAWANYMLAELSRNLHGLQVWLSKKGGSSGFLKFTSLSLLHMPRWSIMYFYQSLGFLATEVYEEGIFWNPAIQIKSLLII